MTTLSLTAELKLAAEGLGFELAGVCPAVEPTGLDRFRQWLSAGYGGEMEYLSSRADAYQHPRSVLAGARSIVMLALNYRTVEPGAPQAGHGRVSRYAWGADYHDVIRSRLARLAATLQRLAPGAQTRAVVETAPVTS